MTDISLKDQFEQARKDGKAYLICLRDSNALSLSSAGRAAGDTAEILNVVVEANKKGNRYYCQKLLAVFDTRRDFDAQYALQCDQGPVLSLVSASFAKEYEETVAARTREISRWRRQEEEDRQRRHRRLRAIYGY